MLLPGRIIMKHGISATICMTAILLLSAQGFAATPTAKMDPGSDIKANLQMNEGQRVYVTLESGHIISGYVGRVGRDVVVITRIDQPGDYYDALIKLDEIAAISMRMR
jgi:hypothetical protein